MMNLETMSLTNTQLSEVLNHQESILDSFPEIIIVYDSDQSVSWMNKLAREVLINGAEPEAYIGRKCNEVWCINTKLCNNCIIKSSIESGLPKEEEKELLQNQYFKITANPIKDDRNKVIGAVGYFRDITSDKQKNAEIIQSREELKLLVENQNELIIKIDIDYKYLYISHSYNELYGHSIHNLKGKDIYRFVVPEDKIFLQKVLDSFQKKIKDKAYAEIRENTLEGIKWIGWSYKPIKDEKGKYVGIVGIGRDITEKRQIEDLLKKKNKDYKALNQELKLQNFNYEKLTSELVKRNNEIKDLFEQLKESEERFRNMFMKHSSIMYLIDPSTRIIINVNEAALRFYGYSQEELLGSNLDKIIAKKNKAGNSKKAGSLKKGMPLLASHKLSNGRIRLVEVYSMPIRIEHESFEFAIVNDITKRYRAEKKLALSEKKLRQANQAKDKFFSIIAHDLKNPFNALIGLSEYIYKRMHKLDRNRIKDITGNMNQVANQSYALLEGLLQWARTQTGSMPVDISVVSINELISTNVLLIKETAKAKEIDVLVTLSGYYYVWADKNMIDTVIRNLLSNAIKFTHRGGLVKITASGNGKQIMVSVSDNGIGMSSKQQQNLFNIDSNYTSPGTEKEKGTGLGLIVCKEFIEKCKGKIWVESEEGQGSTFTFKLKSHK